MESFFGNPQAFCLFGEVEVLSPSTIFTSGEPEMASQPEPQSLRVPKPSQDDAVKLLEWYWQRGMAHIDLLSGRRLV